MRVVVFSILFVLLSACVGYELTEEEKARNEHAKREYCANMGAPEGSPNYYDCRMRIEEQNQAMRMQFLQNQRVRQNQLYNPYLIQQNKVTNCNSNIVGNSVSTNCY